MRYAHWVKYNNNFGDILTPIILRHYGLPVRWCGRGRGKKILAVGSILPRMLPGDIIWGAGTLRGSQKLVAPPGVQFLAVRGPKTRSLVLNADVPEVYGDPAILLPEIFPMERQADFEVGVIFHEAEAHVARPKPDPRVHLIDINSGVKEVIREVTRCQIVLSSTLHGVIVAEAYGIPAVWIKASDKLIGGPWKFNDYYLSTDREPRAGVPWKGDTFGIAAKAEAPPKMNTEPLVEALGPLRPREK